MAEREDKWTRRRYWVRIEPNLGFGSIVATEYTGLTVRRLLLHCSRSAVFALNKSGGPKPISLSPLYRVEQSKRVTALYPRLDERKGSITYPVINDDDILFFEVGVAPHYTLVHNELVECLEKGLVLPLGGHYARISLVRHETVAEFRENGEPITRLKPGEKLRLILASPAQLVSIARPGSQWRVLVPAPFYLFSVNALELHRGSVSGSIMSLLRAEEVLSTAPSLLSTTRVVRVVIGKGRVEPGVIGYVNLYVLDAPEDSIREAERLLNHALVMGVGASRAIGLGTLWLRAPSS